MIRYVQGDLFQSPAQALVNTVNTVGVMGKGIALTFKKLYPDMFRAYQRVCEEGRLEIGTLFLWRTPTKLIVNFPTKTEWRRPSRPEYIRVGLATFVSNFQELGIRSVAFPPLGCGNGELDFAADVQPLMEQYLADLPIPVFIYAPLPRTAVPEHRSIDEMRMWLRRQPAELPFSELWEDLRELLRRRNSFRTLTKGTPVEANYQTDEKRIRVKASGKSYTFTAEEVQELWRELRDHMVATPKSFPLREKELSYLFPVLAGLDYIEAVRLADTYDRLAHSPAMGLHLIPHGERPKQRELILA